MTSLKRHFLKRFLTDFSEILLEGVKLMPDKVLKVSRRYILRFSAIEKIREGWLIFTPHPSADRVKIPVFPKLIDFLHLVKKFDKTSHSMNRQDVNYRRKYAKCGVSFFIFAVLEKNVQT